MLLHPNEVNPRSLPEIDLKSENPFSIRLTWFEEAISRKNKDEPKPIDLQSNWYKTDDGEPLKIKIGSESL